MCIAIYKPAGCVLSKELLSNCFDNNPDGCGFSYVQTDCFGIPHIKVKKTMFFEVFYNQYTRAIRLEPSSPFIIHFRIGTHGVKTRYNCHPFIIDKNHSFIHNGIISRVPNCKKGRKSDTQIFNDLFLKKMPEGWFTNSAILTLLEDYVGGGSKLVFLNKDKQVAICNSKAGVWREHVWFSNTSYMDRSWKEYNYGSKYKSSTNFKTWQEELEEEREEKRQLALLALPSVNDTKIVSINRKVDKVSFATSSLGYGKELDIFPEDRHDDIDEQLLESLAESISSNELEGDTTCFSCGIVDIMGNIHNVPIDGYFTPLCASCEKIFINYGVSALGLTN